MLKTLPPQTLIDNRYRIQSLLGQGGFGRTYLAQDTRRFDEPCVLKELISSEDSDQQKTFALFQQEGKVLYQLNHPQIPNFQAIFEDNGRLFLVQDYVDGKTYLALLEEGGQFSELEVIHWLKDLLPVLEYIHQHKIVHRDISPDNIILPKGGGKPILIDFGVVKQFMTQASTREQQGTLVGKTGYSPPEQLRMGQCFPNSDLYSLAVTALVMLSRQGPTELFDSYGMKWQWQKYIQIGDKFGDILGKMLAETPKERYQSAAEVLAALETLDLMEEPNNIFLSSTSTTKTIYPPTLTCNNPTLSPITFEELETTSLSASSSPNGQKKKKSSIPITIPWFLLLLCGTALGLTLYSLYTPVFCVHIPNCIEEKEYNRAVTKGDQALDRFQQAQSVIELEESLKPLGEAIKQLNQIPPESKTSSKAREQLEKYQLQQEQISARLQQEQAVAKQLADVDILIAKAMGSTENSKTFSQYLTAKTEWETALNLLNQIPQGSLMDDIIKSKKEQCQEQIKAVEDKIKQLNCPLWGPAPPECSSSLEQK